MKFFLKRVVLFVLFVFSADAFLPFPHFTNPMILPNVVISNLEGIVTAKAISHSLLTNLRLELTLDKFLLQLTQFDYHSTDYFYISVFVTYLYGQYKFFKGSESCQIDTKLGKLYKYQKVSRITREIIFIIFVIFTKDVQNAI